MKAVGIRTLNSSLSKYIKMVQHGEIILVLDRDVVVAEIRSPVSTKIPDDPWMHYRAKMIQEGTLIPATSNNFNLNICPDSKNKIDIQALLDSIKEDRMYE